MPTSDATSPSQILTYLDDKLEAILPDDELPTLEAHDADIAPTTSHGDFHRCVHCAEWAVELAGRPEHGHLRGIVRELAETLREIHDATWAVEFGVMTPGRVVTDVELSWVDDAVKVAAAAAEKSGWSTVPWEQLLTELIAIEPKG